jgi:hypothetical protein
MSATTKEADVLLERDFGRRFALDDGFMYFVTWSPNRPAHTELGSVVFTIWLQNGGKVRHAAQLEILDLSKPDIRDVAFAPSDQKAGTVSIRVARPDGSICSPAPSFEIQQVDLPISDPTGWFRIRTDGKTEQMIPPGKYAIIGEGLLSHVVKQRFQVEPGSTCEVVVQLLEDVGRLKWSALVDGEAPDSVFLTITADRLGATTSRASFPASGEMWLPVGTYHLRAGVFGRAPIDRVLDVRRGTDPQPLEIAL